MRPMLVNRLEDRNGNVVQQYAPQRVRQVISDATDKLMIEALKTVVSPEGTAPGAAMKDYTVAGKTGTAQKVGPDGYVPGKYFASFIGFFPADNPQLCISVVMDEPKEGYYGGQVCGPVFREIAERCASYLNIPPDKSRDRPIRRRQRGRVNPRPKQPADAMNHSRPQLFGMLAGLFLAAGLVLSSMLGTAAWVKVKNSQFITVKGSTRRNVESDLVIWTGSLYHRRRQPAGSAAQTCRRTAIRWPDFLAGDEHHQPRFQADTALKKWKPACEVKTPTENTSRSEQQTVGYRLTQSVRVESARR